MNFSFSFYVFNNM